MSRKNQEITMGEITSRIRGFVYDSQVAEGEHISVILGCSEISDEVADKEAEESDRRVGRVSSLIPILYAYAHSMAEGMVDHQRIHLGDEEEVVPPEAWVQTRKVFTQVALNTLLGAVSQLVDMDMLLLTSEKKGLRKWAKTLMKKTSTRRRITRDSQSK